MFSCDHTHSRIHSNPRTPAQRRTHTHTLNLAACCLTSCIRVLQHQWLDRDNYSLRCSATWPQWLISCGVCVRVRERERERGRLHVLSYECAMTRYLFSLTRTYLAQCVVIFPHTECISEDNRIQDHFHWNHFSLIGLNQNIDFNMFILWNVMGPVYTREVSSIHTQLGIVSRKPHLCSHGGHKALTIVSVLVYKRSLTLHADTYRSQICTTQSPWIGEDTASVVYQQDCFG